MKKVFAETFPMGYIAHQVESVALVNNTEKTIEYTCPDDTVIEIISIYATNPDDVARDVGMTLFTDSGLGTVAAQLMYASGVPASSWVTFPNNDDQSFTYRNHKVLLIRSGETIQIRWKAGGASSGGTDADGLVIRYRKLSLT